MRGDLISETDIGTLDGNGAEVQHAVQRPFTRSASPRSPGCSVRADKTSTLAATILANRRAFGAIGVSPRLNIGAELHACNAPSCLVRCTFGASQFAVRDDFAVKRCRVMGCRFIRAPMIPDVDPLQPNRALDRERRDIGDAACSRIPVVVELLCGCRRRLRLGTVDGAGVYANTIYAFLILGGPVGELAIPALASRLERHVRLINETTTAESRVRGRRMCGHGSERRGYVQREEPDHAIHCCLNSRRDRNQGTIAQSAFDRGQHSATSLDVACRRRKGLRDARRTSSAG